MFLLPAAGNHYPDKVSFLLFPPEVRLMIYSYLWNRTLTISTLGPAVNPSGVFCEYQTEGVCDDPLHLAILTTCRTIYKEAWTIFFGRNVFNFCSDFHALPFPASSFVELDQASRNLMSNPIDEWKELKLPEQIRNSVFAAFLRKIGPCNAAKIRKLKISAWDYDQAATDITLARILCRYHLPRLECLEVNISATPTFWCGPFEPMYNALRGFIEESCRLKSFTYGMNARLDIEDEAAMYKIEDLEMQEIERRQSRDREESTLRKYKLAKVTLD